MDAINLRYLAWLYFEERGTGPKYDWGKAADRVKCRNNFAKLVSKDAKVFDRAVKRYIETVVRESEEVKRPPPTFGPTV